MVELHRKEDDGDLGLVVTGCCLLFSFCFVFMIAYGNGC